MQLKKELGLFEVFCIATGAMISSGLFILPGLAYNYAGPAVVLSYFIAGLLAMTGMLSIAEMATAMPKAGGDYFFITRGFGPAVGTISGLFSWFSLSLKSAFALIGMAAFTSLVLPGYDIKFIAIILSLIFMMINIIGVKESGRFQVYLVSALLALMAFYIIVGLPKVSSEYFLPFSPFGFDGIFSTAGFVFTAYGGLLYVGSVAEEVKNPNKVIPLGMIISLLVVSILYTLMVFVTVGVVPGSQLAGNLTPISAGAHALMGHWGMLVLSFAAILAFVSTANGGLLSASRYPMSLSRDGLMPNFLSRISTRFRTPYKSIILTTIALIVFLLLDLEILVRAVSTSVILTNILSCLALIVMRESRLQNYRPVFKAPLYPYIQIIGIIGFIFLLFEMGLSAILITFLLILIGFFTYWFYGRIRSSREYALLYLLERISSKEITSYTLETELKEIIRERDQISEDHFDQLIKTCHVLDINEYLQVEQFFHLAAAEIQKDLKLSEEEVFKALIKREREYTTVIGENLAIPHIIVPGEETFSILVARSKKGIRFSDQHPRITTVFVIAGSKDQRTFHLRALAAIAQIANDPLFNKKWLHANSVDALRDAILLANRNRDKYFTHISKNTLITNGYDNRKDN
ncbi:MAG: amino acid permease [Candidatus Cloacimonetes bacterium]|nr:amino acid permease [Candidatus Cloacimonadota bacterium]